MMAMMAMVLLCACGSLTTGVVATGNSGSGAQHSLLSVALNRSSYEWVLSEFPGVDLTRPRFEQDDVVRVDLYQSREEFAMLRGRFPAEFAAAKVVQGEGEVQATIVAERERLSSRARVPLDAPLSTRKQVFFSDFRDYDEITAYIDVLLLEPSIEVRPITIGETREGRPIRTYEFTGAGGLAKPTVYLQGTAHANEWMGTMACVYSMTELVERYAAGDPEIVELMDSLVFVATPVLNVDGYCTHGPQADATGGKIGGTTVTAHSVSTSTATTPQSALGALLAPRPTPAQTLSAGLLSCLSPKIARTTICLLNLQRRSRY